MCGERRVYSCLCTSTITDGSVVLLVIHTAGWVHRDLSTGNLYLYTDPVTGEKRGLVGDLELAKRAGSGKDGDVRAVS